MIPDSLFSPSQSPCFFFSKSLFLPSQSPVFFLFKVLSHPLEVLFPPLKFPFPSSPLLFLRAKENSGTTRSRPAVCVVVCLRLYLCLRYWRMCMITFTVHPFPSILYCWLLEHSHLYHSGIV